MMADKWERKERLRKKHITKDLLYTAISMTEDLKFFLHAKAHSPHTENQTMLDCYNQAQKLHNALLHALEKTNVSLRREEIENE